MLRILGLIALFITVALVGTGVAALFTFVLGFAGFPGRLVVALKNTIAVVAGTLLIILAQSYASLIFAAAVIGSARVVLENSTSVTKWAFWMLAVWLSFQPNMIAMRSILNERKPGELMTEVDSIATGIACLINVLGAIAFAIFPSTVEWGWGWVPHVEVVK